MREEVDKKHFAEETHDQLPKKQTPKLQTKRQTSQKKTPNLACCDNSAPECKWRQLIRTTRNEVEVEDEDEEDE